jgi:Cdc6-like AAA superfamily ATPase
VISNRDVASMRVLDQWLHYVDTEEVLPLFEKLELDYKVPKLENVDWNSRPSLVRNVCRDNNLSSLGELKSIKDLQDILDLLLEHNEKARLRDVVSQILLLAADSTFALKGQAIASSMIHYLPKAVYLTTTFLRSQIWNQYKEAVEDELISLAPLIAREFVLATNEYAGFVRQPFSLLLHELKMVSLQGFAELVELIALTIRSPEIALDLLFEVFEPEIPRLLVGRPIAIRQFATSLFGIALDHIDEAASGSKPGPESIKLAIGGHEDGYTIVKSVLRVDSSMGGSLKAGDHVRLTVTNPPHNDPLAKLFSMDALVLGTEPGAVTFRCLHHPPSYLTQCAWSIAICGSFVTSKSSFDAVTTFYTQREACCKIYASLLGLPDADQIELSNVDLPVVRDATLNASQNDALTAAMKHSVTLIWGPPGTGKTHTIIVILCQLLRALPKSRFLITAPTHNAVDNILRRFIVDINAKELGISAMRVSTQVSYKQI